MNDPTPDTKVTVSPSVYARPFGAEMVVLDFGRGEYFALDEVGAEIWRALEGRSSQESRASVSDLVERVTERFEVARDVALRDIVELLCHMRREGLVTW